MTTSDIQNDPATFDPAETKAPYEGAKGKWERVYLYGYASGESDDVFRLYQGLGVSQFYEIPRKAVISVTAPTCKTNPSLIKMLLPSNTQIKYVSSKTATLPAGSLAAVVATHKRESDVSPADRCPVGCYCNGICICTSINYWFDLSPDAAQRLGVVIDGNQGKW